MLKKIKPSKLENAHIKATAEEIINVSSKLSKAKKIVFIGTQSSFAFFAKVYFKSSGNVNEICDIVDIFLN